MNKSIVVRDTEGRYKIEIIFEDNDILVINKPAGLLTIPDHWNKEKSCLRDVLSGYVRKSQGLEKIYVVHRLDKETSGVMIFAKNAESHRALNTAFENGEISKTYIALVAGHIQEEEGEIDAPISRKMIKGGRKFIDEKKGLPSRTRFRVLERFRHFTLVEARPETGRMHQIRLHFSHIGYPLAIDRKYHDRYKTAIYITDIKPNARIKREQEIRPIIHRLTLHALKISFHHPVSGENVTFEAPLPKDFKSLIQLLQKWNI
jgi:23S rRNA pseudouridine955/2504/2580 synthase/23S rRNA pseudouridine1911/1915/1917 synthase